MRNKLHALYSLSKQIIHGSVIPFGIIFVTGIVLHAAFLYYLTVASMILIGVFMFIHGVTGFLIAFNEYKRYKKTNNERRSSQSQEEHCDD